MFTLWFDVQFDPQDADFVNGIGVHMAAGEGDPTGAPIVNGPHATQILEVQDNAAICIPEPSGVLSLGALLGLGLMFRTRR